MLCHLTSHVGLVSLENGSHCERCKINTPDGVIHDRADVHAPRGASVVWNSNLRAARLRSRTELTESGRVGRASFLSVLCVGARAVDCGRVVSSQHNRTLPSEPDYRRPRPNQCGPCTRWWPLLLNAAK